MQTNEEKLIIAIRDQLVLDLIDLIESGEVNRRVLERAKIPKTDAVMEASRVSQARVLKMLQSQVRLKVNKPPKRRIK